MAFWNKKKKEPEKEIVTVKCGCGASYDVECEGLGTMGTGYKGRIAFYTRCTHCEELIYVDESKLPKKYLRKAYRNHIWG